MRRWLGLVAMGVVAGCSSPPPPAPIPPVVPAVVDTWMLGTKDAKAVEPALLWNGLVGIRLNRDGTGAGQKLFAIDEYETSGEEKIRPLPNPLAFRWMTAAGEVLDPAKGTDYAQTLDMRNGTLATQWSQTVGGHPVKVAVKTILHPEQRQIAFRWTFSGEVALAAKPEPDSPKPIPDGAGKYRYQIDPSGMRAEMMLRGGRKPPGADELVEVDTEGGGDATVELTFSFGRSPNWISMLAARGIQVRMMADWDKPGAPLTFDQLQQVALETWRKRWLTDIEIDGPDEDQQAIRSFLFYLRSSIHKEGGMSVSPFGLSNAMYNGHVFWDADIWVFPALALIDPQAARQIPEYRLAMFRAAQGRAAKGDKGGAQYPWESSVSGQETVPGPSQKELHITGSVAWAMKQATSLGLVPRNLEFFRACDDFYRSRSVAGPKGREIRDVMSPDENHTGDNDLYTNLLAQWLSQGRTWSTKKASGLSTPNPLLSPERKEGALYYIPRDSQSLITYDGDRFRGYKQAAAVLSIYPLQYPPAEKDAEKMMERFESKVIKNGPAMTDSVHATIWARLGKTDRAYASWRESWEPFTRHPLMLFSEKRTKMDTYFTTGAGGALQSVLFGFLGFRLDWEKEPGAKWSTPLGDQWLSVKPNLPPQWKSVTLRNFNVMGRRLTLNVSPSAVRVVPGG